MRKLAHRDTSQFFDSRGNVQGRTTRAGEDLGNVRTRDPKVCREVGLTLPGTFQVPPEFFRTSVSHALHSSDLLQGVKRKVNGGDNFSLTRSVASSYANLSGVLDSAGLLRYNVKRLL